MLTLFGLPVNALLGGFQRNRLLVGGQIVTRINGLGHLAKAGFLGLQCLAQHLFGVFAGFFEWDLVQELGLADFTGARVTQLELACVLAGGVGAVDPVVNHAWASVVGGHSQRWRLEIVGQLLKIGLAKLTVVVRVIAKAVFIPFNTGKLCRFWPGAGHDLSGTNGATARRHRLAVAVKLLAAAFRLED